MKKHLQSWIISLRWQHVSTFGSRKIGMPQTLRAFIWSLVSHAKRTIWGFFWEGRSFLFQNFATSFYVSCSNHEKWAPAPGHLTNNLQLIFGQGLKLGEIEGRKFSSVAPGFNGGPCLRTMVITHTIHVSGQIIIFHQPRFPWNKGIFLPQLPFGVRSCEVAIIWPDVWYIYLHLTQSPRLMTWPGKRSATFPKRKLLTWKIMFS